MAKTAKKAAAAETETVVAYKGFDANLACRGYQYELGKTYEHKGRVEACSSGFHACENPFDVWSYYGPGSGNRFARVTLSGALARHSEDSKIAAGRITLDAELRLPDFIADAVKWVIAATKPEKPITGSTAGGLNDNGGDSAKIGSSGDSAKIGSSGHSAQIGSSGHYAQIGSSGHYAQIGSSGHYAKIGSSGHYAKIGSSGHSAKIGSSGESAKIEASGKGAVVACAASATVKAGPGGAICIPYYDGQRARFVVGYVGEDGIKADTWYRAEAGKLVEI